MGELCAITGNTLPALPSKLRVAASVAVSAADSSPHLSAPERLDLLLPEGAGSRDLDSLLLCVCCGGSVPAVDTYFPPCPAVLGSAGRALGTGSPVNTPSPPPEPWASARSPSRLLALAEAFLGPRGTPQDRPTWPVLIVPIVGARVTLGRRRGWEGAALDAGGVWGCGVPPSVSLSGQVLLFQMASSSFKKVREDTTGHVCAPSPAEVPSVPDLTSLGDLDRAWPFLPSTAAY